MIKRHAGFIDSGAFSPDGTKIVIASYGTAKIWDLKSGKLLHILKYNPRGYHFKVHSAKFSPDKEGKYLLANSWYDNPIKSKIWNSKTGQLLYSFEEAVKFSPDGTKIIIYLRDHTPKIMDIETGCVLYELEAPKPGFWIHSPKFSPDGKYIITASGGRPRLWDAQNGNLIRTFDDYANENLESITYAGFSPDSTKVVTISHYTTGKIWDVATGKLLYNLPELESITHAMRIYFSADSSKLYIISTRGVKIFDIATGKAAQPFANNKRGLSQAALSPNGKYLITPISDDDDPSKIYDAATGKLLYNLGTQKQRVRSTTRPVFSPDSSKVFTATEDWSTMYNNIYLANIWDLDTHKKI
jgi:WD40 repeat protein